MRILRVLGADPARVGVMIRAVERDAEGRWAERTKEYSGSVEFGPGVMHLLLMAFMTMFSLLTAGLMVLAPDGDPGLGPIALSVPFLSAFLGAGVQGYTMLLATDDAPVVGHWPVTARDVGMARLWIVVRRTIQIGFATAVAPTLMVAFKASPIVLTAVVTFGAALLASVGAAFFVALSLFGLRRLLGRRRAQRFGAMAMLVACFLFGLAPHLQAEMGTAPEWLRNLLPLLGLIPPFSFFAWPLLLLKPLGYAIAMVVLSLVTLAALTLVTVRMIAGVGAAERVEARSNPRAGRFRWLETSLRPWLPGSRAQVARLLFVAHAREDWRFLGRIALLPIQLAFFLAGPFLEDGPLQLVAVAQGLRTFHLLVGLMAVMAASTVVASVSSSLRDASWVVASSPAARGDWAAWQRGFARAIGLPVVVPVVLVLHVLAATSPWLVVDDLVVLILAHEAGLRVAQWVQWRPPFSVPTGVTDARSVGTFLLLAITVLPGGIAWLAFVHVEFAWAPPLTYAALLGTIAFTRRATSARELVFV